MKSRNPCEIAALVVESLIAGPVSLKQICIDCGIALHHTETAKKYVAAHHSRGRVRIIAWTHGGQWPVYEWQDVLHANSDAERPKPAPSRRSVTASVALGGQS